MGKVSALNDPAVGPKLRLLRDSRLWLSVAEIAEVYNVTPQAVYKWMHRTKNPFPKPIAIAPRVSRVSVDAIIQYMKRQAREAGIDEQLYG
jgi:predicted DNA-binding transcriptional regulator AlpA